MILDESDIFDASAHSLDERQKYLSMHRVTCMFDAVIGRPLRTPEDWDEQEFGAYEAAWRKVQEYIDTHAEETLQLNDLAAMANRELQVFIQQDPIVPFEDIAPLLREKWRFLIRHLYNLLAYDKNEDGTVQAHEEQIEAHFRHTLEGMSLITRSSDVQ